MSTSLDLFPRLLRKSALWATIVGVLLSGVLCLGCGDAGEGMVYVPAGSAKASGGAAGSAHASGGSGGAALPGGSGGKAGAVSADSGADDTPVEPQPSNDASVPCTTDSCPAGQTCTNGVCVAQAKTKTIADIVAAATLARTYITANTKLPNDVAVANDKVDMPSFLMLEVTAVTEIGAEKDDAIPLKSYAAAASPQDTTKRGTLQKSEFLTVAAEAKSYLEAHKQAPDSVNCTLGAMGFDNLVYVFAKILDFYGANQRLPNSVKLDLFSEGADIDPIGKEEATYADCQISTNQGCSDWKYMEANGCGDCWADSEWLYNHLSAVGVPVRVMGYTNCPSGSIWDRHAWVQIDLGNGWQDWDYVGYNSQHFGDGGGFSTKVLIEYGKGSIDVSTMIATGY